jgi:hypothetical protein
VVEPGEDRAGLVQPVVGGRALPDVVATDHHAEVVQRHFDGHVDRILDVRDPILAFAVVERDDARLHDGGFRFGRRGRR